MKIVELSKVPVDGHRFRTLLARPALCAEVVASIAEAIGTTREEMHAQLSPSGKGMHTYTHAMTNLGHATDAHGGRLKVVNGQQRVVFDQTDGLGELHVALTKGVPSAGGFDVSRKGAATEQLMGIPQQSLDLDLPDVPMDDGAFFVHMLLADPLDEANLDVVVYLAHPAKLNNKKTFLYCDECVLLGRRSVRVAPMVTEEIVEEAADVTPQIDVRGT